MKTADAHNKDLTGAVELPPTMPVERTTLPLVELSEDKAEFLREFLTFVVEKGTEKFTRGAIEHHESLDLIRNGEEDFMEWFDSGIYKWNRRRCILRAIDMIQDGRHSDAVLLLKRQV